MAKNKLDSLQKTAILSLKERADQASAWLSFRNDLHAFTQNLPEEHTDTGVVQVLKGLEHAAGVLAEREVVHCGSLAAGQCADILASLEHYLESPASSNPHPENALSDTKERMSQLEDLLKNTDESSASELPAADNSSLTTAEPDMLPEAGDLLTIIGLAEADPEFVKIFLEEAQGEIAVIQENAALWRENLEDSEVLATLRRSFHTLKGSGRTVGAQVIGDFAWDFEDLLNHVLNEGLPASTAMVDAVVAAATALAPLVGVVPLKGGELDALPGLSAQARALLEARPQQTPEPASKTEPATPSLITVEELAPGADSEFLDVFLEEARGELETIRAQRILWQENLDDHKIPGTIRRAFHTLKGSGRVVGMTVVGDFACTFEELLKHVLSGELPASVAISDLVEEAAVVLEPLVSGEPVPGNFKDSMVRLVDRADMAIKGISSSESAAPESAAPESAAPESAAPESAVPESVVPESAVPESVVPESAVPESAVPESAVPESAVPESAVPESAAPVKEPLPELPLEPITTVRRPTLIAQVTPSADAVTTAPQVPMPEPAPMALPDIDPEMAEVFQYEAGEILDNSDRILQKLGDNVDNSTLLNDLRRGMHTLKGGARLAGFMSIGDLAHAAESVLDALSKHNIPAAPVVLETLQNALDQLNRMLSGASGGVYPAPAIDLMQDLLHLADSINSGELSEQLPSAARRAAITQQSADVPEPVASPSAMTELDQELVQAFVSEASEILDASDTILRGLGDNPGNTGLLNNLRREMHTLKGGARLAGFMAIGDLAHAAESILDALDKQQLEATPQVLEKIQLAMDHLNRMLVDVLDGGQPVVQQSLIEELHQVLGAKPTGPAPTTRTVTSAAATSVAARPSSAEAVTAPGKKPADAAADTIRVSVSLLNNLVNQMGESSIFRARIDQGVSAMSFNMNELEQTVLRLRRQVSNLANQAETRMQSRQDIDAKGHQVDFDPLELDRFTELQQVSRSLMEIADDLGNLGSTLGEHSREITNLLDQQAKVNKEIQQGLMRTGMVRFGTVIPRLRRVVRQAAQELGKRAKLLVSGDESEVDRTVLESMVAPLEHMLRNSLSHGIETPARRREINKSDVGTITLSLRREGAELVLEMGDDGAGLNFEAIRAKGEEKGILLPGQPATPDELIALLLRPGFSTAGAVTQISGRGVGMDVVNAAIRAMRGALLVETEANQGTRFIIRLPFSLSVTQALLVEAGESTLAIPLISIEMVTRIDQEDFKRYLTGEQVYYKHNENQYPVHNLGILVGSERIVPYEEVADRRPPILLFRSAEASAALQVESVLGNQEVIVKPVSPQFNSVHGISGATVLGDGRVVVVLELAALVRHIGSQTLKQFESRALRVARQEIREEKLSVMVIDDSITMRKVTARILERHQIEAITAKDGMDAVAQLQTRVPDLAILDIEMPRMDGFEVLAHVRNQTHLQHMPIIMVTSRGGDKHRDRAMRLGVNDYLTKPYQEEQLMASIRNILGEEVFERLG
ncbi:MAG: hypothetical protein CSA09_03150 [Candidatus Contendobacter odensis]|uniref:Chemotaxis protein CheA n=1 Tax=Candidatus Contendibacter odensensis TaxID=1400860 RepID=A0A2G6PET6_9GAMM|nr:MAG: hypothetical protein CSA09_03150 [Candidatus Contendobacter odensis]